MEEAEGGGWMGVEVKPEAGAGRRGRMKSSRMKERKQVKSWRNNNAAGN